MCSLYRSTTLLSSKYNSTYSHYCPNNWQQKWVHPKWTFQNCPKCQYFVGAPLLSSTALILLGMEFTRAAQVVAGILFHSSIMTSRSCWMLDTWCFSTFCLRMPHMCSIGFRSGDILGHSITFSFISKAVVILGWLLCWKAVSEGRASSSASECHSTCWNPCFPQWTAAPQYQQHSCSPRPWCYHHL